MTTDDIQRMAYEADPFGDHGRLVSLAMLTPGTLERFAALVAAAEREECAKVCEQQAPAEPNCVWDAAYKHVVSDCAAAIRARGKT